MENDGANPYESASDDWAAADARRVRLPDAARDPAACRAAGNSLAAARAWSRPGAGRRTTDNAAGISGDARGPMHSASPGARIAAAQPFERLLFCVNGNADLLDFRQFQ